VPPLVVFLAKAEIVDEYDLSSVQRIYSGAAPLSEEIETLVKKRLGIDSVSQAYGLTETTLIVIGQLESVVKKKGSVGTLRPGVKCKVNSNLIKIRQGGIQIICVMYCLILIWHSVGAGLNFFLIL
jgi:acyl-coenzyme A synthetase/AMP-(fatty) acid ligase